MAVTNEGIPATELARRLGRSEEAVRERRRRLGRSSGGPRRYTPREDAVLRAAYIGEPRWWTWLASWVGLPTGFACERGCSACTRASRNRAGAPEETGLVREGYAEGLAYAAIAERLPGRTPAAVGAYARELGRAART